MSLIEEQTSVLIVGAGPSGLMMAAQLLRYGIQPTIIDSRKSLTKESRALVVQPRSMEIFRQMGLADQLMEAGNQVSGLGVYDSSGPVADLELSASIAQETPFPYILMLEQSKTERILLDYLTSKACPVHWDTELVSLSASDKNVRVELRSGGLSKTLECAWLVGADGASSPVRKALHISFSGSTYVNRFYLADLSLLETPAAERVSLFLNKEGFTGVFPMAGSMCRFMGALPPALKGRMDVGFNDVKPYLTYTLGFPAPAEHCKWFSVYQLHHRLADRFRAGRCFLIGDAAQVHSPLGGQGMNTGLQDAYNLAWKLAGVIQNEYNESVLDSYAAERMPISRRLLKSSDRMFALAVARNRLLRSVRNYVLPGLLAFVWGSEKRRLAAILGLTQLSIHYTGGPLSIHHSQGRKIKAGERLPFFRVFDEKKEVEVDLHSWCSAPGFTMIVMGKLSERDLLLMAKWVKSAYPFYLSFYYLPRSPRNESVFQSFEIPEKGKKVIVVRPDLHIGYMNDAIDPELIDNYLKGTVGWKRPV